MAENIVVDMEGETHFRSNMNCTSTIKRVFQDIVANVSKPNILAVIPRLSAVSINQFFEIYFLFRSMWVVHVKRLFKQVCL